MPANRRCRGVAAPLSRQATGTTGGRSAAVARPARAPAGPPECADVLTDAGDTASAAGRMRPSLRRLAPVGVASDVHRVSLWISGRGGPRVTDARRIGDPGSLGRGERGGSSGRNAAEPPAVQGRAPPSRRGRPARSADAPRLLRCQPGCYDARSGPLRRRARDRVCATSVAPGLSDAASVGRSFGRGGVRRTQGAVVNLRVRRRGRPPEVESAALRWTRGPSAQLPGVASVKRSLGSAAGRRLQESRPIANAASRSCWE